jgi:hypothetical protein
LCQRYYYFTGTTNDVSFFNVNTDNVAGCSSFPTTMRATPTIAIFDGTTSGQVALIGGGTGTINSITAVSKNGIGALNGSSLTGLGGVQFNYSASAEL